MIEYKTSVVDESITEVLMEDFILMKNQKIQI